jgi:CheY-like chemotaxis protein
MRVPYSLLRHRRQSFVKQPAIRLARSCTNAVYIGAHSLHAQRQPGVRPFQTETVGRLLHVCFELMGVAMGRVQSKRRKVLIVEDETELRLLMKTMLEESELDIIECQSAEAALATMLLRGQDVAMIFADIHLSGEMDGIDLAREVKIRWPHLVVILTSGNAGEHLKQMPPGVDYMPKPWQPLDVLIAAERARFTTGGR